MALTELVGFIGKDNIVDQLTKEQRDQVGEDVKRRFSEDLDSMGDWKESVENSRDLSKPEFHGRDKPFPNASNFKTSLLAESAIAFGDKASLEILRNPTKLVKGDIIGKQTPEKKKRAENISEAMNYQINYMMDWVEEQKRLFYFLPNDGTVFKKTFFDPTEQETLSEIIQYPDFVVNQATKSMKKCRSFTQILDISMNDAVARYNSGVWDGDIEDIYPKDSDGDAGSNEAEGTTDADHNTDRFLEQQCWADLDEDGYEEPYIVTFHEETSTIVRIVPRFNEDSIVVKNKETGRVTKLKKGAEDQRDSFVQASGGLEAVELIGLQPPTTDFTKFDLVKIDPFVNITKYGFIPSNDGTFLDQGYAHLLGANAQAINKTTNQLTDAGTLRNQGGGFTAKGFRKKKGPTKIPMGGYIPTDMSPGQLANSIFPNPSPEPSPTLFQLNQDLKAEAKGFSVIIDQSGQIQANTAPTTALAIIQEGLISTSALFGRILDAESKEFQVIFRLDQRFFDPEMYKEILDDPNADSNADFNSGLFDLVPTANAEMASKTQRLQASEVELGQIQLVLQSGGNIMPILKNYYEAIGGTPVDQIWPPEGSELSAADKQAQDALLAEQKKANEIKDAQLEIEKIRINLLQREEDRLDKETNAKVEKFLIDSIETEANIEKIMAEVKKILEEAETESLNNAITTYSASVQIDRDNADAIGALNDRRVNQALLNPGGAIPQGSIQ